MDLESVELVDLNLPALMDSLPHRFALMGGDQGELVSCENTSQPLKLIDNRTCADGSDPGSGASERRGRGRGGDR